MSGCASVTSPPFDPRDVASIGQSRYQIKSFQCVAWLHLGAESMGEHLGDLARAVDVAQRPIDREAEILVAVRQGKSVGFEREIIVGETQLAGVAALGGEIGEDRPIAEIGD